jgi:hypothetical protein
MAFCAKQPEKLVSTATTKQNPVQVAAEQGTDGEMVVTIVNNNQHEIHSKIEVRADNEDPTDCRNYHGEELIARMFSLSKEQLKDNLVKFGPGFRLYYGTRLAQNVEDARTFLLTLDEKDKQELIKKLGTEGIVFLNKVQSKVDERDARVSVPTILISAQAGLLLLCLIYKSKNFPGSNPPASNSPVVMGLKKFLEQKPAFHVVTTTK